MKIKGLAEVLATALVVTAGIIGISKLSELDERKKITRYELGNFEVELVEHVTIYDEDIVTIRNKRNPDSSVSGEFEDGKLRGCFGRGVILGGAFTGMPEKALNLLVEEAYKKGKGLDYEKVECLEQF